MKPPMSAGQLGQELIEQPCRASSSGSAARSGRSGPRPPPGEIRAETSSRRFSIWAVSATMASRAELSDWYSRHERTRPLSRKIRRWPSSRTAPPARSRSSATRAGHRPLEVLLHHGDAHGVPSHVCRCRWARAPRIQGWETRRRRRRPRPGPPAASSARMKASAVAAATTRTAARRIPLRRPPRAGARPASGECLRAAEDAEGAADAGGLVGGELSGPLLDVARERLEEAAVAAAGDDVEDLAPARSVGHAERLEQAPPPRAPE